jgi:replicative DNA helicase
MHKEKKGQRPAVDISNLVYGKVPPQARDLEAAVLGAIMLERDAIDIAVEILKPGCFYLSEHVLIFTAICSLHAKGKSIDILTVVEELKLTESLVMAGGPYKVTALTNAVVSSANVEDHCKIIKEKWLAREMIRISGETVAEGYDDTRDIFDLISEHDRKFTELTTGAIAKTFVGIDAAMVQSLQRLEELRGRDETISGIPSGFTDLDRLTNGWQNADLIILAARPAVGKTAFALQLARKAAMNHENPVPVCFFSLEMPTYQLTNRMLSAESGILLEKITRGRMDDIDMKHLYGKAVHPLAKANIVIDDQSTLTIVELRAKARRLKRKWERELKTKKGLIIIDYLQLMNGNKSGKGNREQEISEISRGLKQLAKELEIPIIALSQLSRAVESRTGDKKGIPQLSDLRESGAIEQDADMVMFLYRPEYYDIVSNEQGESTKGETHVKIAKHRGGELDTVKLVANLSTQSFESWSGDFQAPIYGSLKKAETTWTPVSDNRYEKEKDEDSPF